MRACDKYNARLADETRQSMFVFVCAYDYLPNKD